MELIPAATGREAGYTLDSSPACQGYSTIIFNNNLWFQAEVAGIRDISVSFSLVNLFIHQGTVIIIANHGDRIDIPAGAMLENKIVSGNLRILDHWGLLGKMLEAIWILKMTFKRFCSSDEQQGCYSFCFKQLCQCKGQRSNSSCLQISPALWRRNLLLLQDNHCEVWLTVVIFFLCQ